MLLHNHPATSYISWFGLVIIDETDTPYVITDGKSCMKYIYWEMDNPYVLRESNEWIMESSTRRMIYINDNGTGTEVPHDTIAINYNDTGNGSSSKLVGEALGKFDELNGKYITIKEDVDGIKEVLGSSETGGDGNNSLIERLNILEKTAEGTTERISTVEKSFTNDKELEQLRNNLNISIIDVGEALSYYRESFSNASKDLEVSTDESLDISQKQTELLDAYTVLAQYHEALITRLTNSEEDNTTVINNLNNSLNSLRTSINNLNSIVNTAISDNTIVPSELTTVLNLLATVALRNNEYKNLVSDSILLGIGGRLTESILNIRKTSSEFSQTISEVVEEIDGETGLKVAVAKNATAIEQNSREISLSCVKFDETTSKLTVGDGVIKLDASQVLMTGTLTWDSLDDEAKQNLKGADGSAEYVMLTGDQIFKYDRNNNPNVQHITLSAQISNIENPIYDWYYKNVSISTDWIHITDNTNLSTLTLYHNDAMWGDNENSITIRVVCNGLSDDMTIVKLYDGEKGIDSKTVKINGEQLFRYKTVNSTPEPTSIVLNGSRNNIVSTASRWYYKNSENGDWTEITAFRGFDSLTISHDSSYFGSSNILMIKYEVEMYDDVMTLAKIYDGSDGYFVLLTNENHSVPCDENGNYDSASLENAHTYIRVYKGLEEVNSFSVTRVDSGCVSSYNSSTKRLDITRLTENTATVTMTITVENTSFQKVMTITKSIKGEKGEDGTGVNVIGQLDDVSQLPSTGSPGDAYIINGLLYVWSDITNGWSDGVPFRGEQGLPGKPGEDGRTTYLHIKYSNDGQTFTNNNGEEPGDWLGQYTDYFEDDSTTFSDYTWKKIKGEDGDNGIVANLTNDTHIIPVNADGTFGEDSFEGCSTKISLSYIGVEITNGVTYGYTASDGVEGNFDSSTGTYTVTGWSGTGTSAYVDLKAIYNGVTYTKRFDITKSKSPYDAYTIILTNESHTFAGDVTNALNGSTTCDIFAYKGTQLVNLFVGTITNIPTGMNVSISNNNTSNVTLNISVNTSMTSGYGTLDIPISIGQLNFTKTFSYAVSFRGAQGLQGIPGIPGEDGKDGNSVKVLGRYDTLDQLNQAHPSGNENGDGYMVGKDLYIWNGTTFINAGQIRGNDGKDGVDGTNGTNAYVHIKYSNDGGKTFTSNSGETPGDYMGVYTDSIQADSTNPSDYNWSLTKGNDGWDAYTVVLSNESHTFAGGTSGAIAGSTTCNVIAYKGGTQVAPTIGSITGVPTGMSTSISNNNSSNAYFTVSVTTAMTTRNGVLTVPITIDGITFTKRFTYSLSLSGTDGSDGADARLLTLSANRQTIAYNNNNTVKDNTAITLTANQQNFNDTITWSTSPSVTLNGSGTSRTLAVSNFNNNTTIRVTITAGGLSDTVTLVKVLDGNNGEPAYNVVLSNESHTFAGGETNAIAGSTTCRVLAYRGSTQVACSIGTISNIPTGMSINISNNNTVNATLNISVTTSMSSKNGTVNIPITIDGHTFTKTFTYALALMGSTGLDAKLLSLSASKQAIAFNSNNTPKDTSAVTLTALQQNFSDSITWSTSPSVTLSGSGNSRILSVSNFTNNNVIKVTITAGSLSDTITLVKVIDGTDGTDGSDGKDGIDGYVVNISNDNHTFVANENGAIVSQQATTTVVTAFRGTTSVAPTIGTLPTVNGLTLSRNGSTITIIAPVGSNMATHGTFNIPVTIDGISFNKAFSYSKVNCGENGEDGYTVILTNEAHIFPCASNGNIATAISTTTVVRAFKGNTEITPTIGTLPSVTGLTLSKSGTTITIRANTGTSLASSGSFDIPVTVDGKTFTKTFSWAKSFAGEDGKFEDEIPAWITEWDNGKTTINGSTILTPKLFTGTVSNGKPTGVAIGKNVFGTSGDYANISGIVGYKNGTKTYEFNTNGSVLIGNNNKHIKWDGTNFEIIADKITLGATNISDNINDVKTEYYISTSSKTLTGGSWSTNPPTIKVGKYIWQRTKTVTVSGTISYSTPVCVNNDGYTIMLSNETLLLKCDSEGRVI